MSVLATMAFSGIPIISHLHNNPTWIKNSLDPRTVAYNIALRKINKVICVSSSVIDEFRSKQLKNKSTIIPNIVDTNRIERLAIEDVSNSDSDLCLVGRLTSQKNPLFFCEIVKKIKEQKYKINCCLLSPIYYNMNKDILKKLNNLFSDDLSIENVIVHEHDLKNIKPELIISTVPLKRIPAIPNVRINPFIGEKDKQLINKAIRDIKHQREIQLFKTNLENITNPDLFFLQTKQISKETVLKILCNALEKQGFCQSNYLAHIQKREQLSSTAFGKVAIPHSIKMIGQKTGMAILINPNGIQWGNSIVNIVLMLCIQSNDKKLFHEIFNQLSEILTNEHLNQKLATSNDFHEFTEKLLAFL